MSVFKGNSVLLLLVLVLFSLQHGTDSLGKPFEYYQLVMRWPKAVCYHKPDEPYRCVMEADRVPLRFTLHGMWASNWINVGDGIDCDEAGTPFQIDEMIKQKTLQEQLKQSWPTLLDNYPTDMKFWQHEYDKHGQCSQDTTTQTEYFSRAHKLWQELQAVYQAFADEKIVPAADKTYTYTQLEQAIGKRFGSNWKVVILCRKVNLSPGGRGPKQILLLLHEIVFCFDNKATEKKSCNRKTNCENAKTITFIN
ncbi:hypothetical protein ABKV19_014247 [Rosa sericea]